MIVGDELGNVFSHIVDFAEGFKEGDQLKETSVTRIVIPGEDRDRILLVEGVGGRRIINDQTILKGSTKQRHILYIDSLDRGTMLSEEPIVYQSSLVKDVH